jgi:putative heme iron utilization protein
LTVGPAGGTVGPMQTAADSEYVAQARTLMRSLDRATLASALPPELARDTQRPWPYASLVLVAVDHDLSPILLLSDLAEHSKAIAADPQVSLLFDATAGLAQPLTGPRLTVLGQIERTDNAQIRRRFLARHPDAEMYAGFRDFRFYRVDVRRAHLVAGFGRIRWVEGVDLVVRDVPAALADHEADIVTHMNDDHADAVQLYAARLLHLAGEGWRLTGIDSAGIDLRLAGTVARLEFSEPVCNPADARARLVDLVRQARQRG